MLRVNLESELIKGKSLKDYLSYDFMMPAKERQKVPMVLIVIKGGFKTLELLYSHQSRAPMPILLMLVSWI